MTRLCLAWMLCLAFAGAAASAAQAVELKVGAATVIRDGEPAAATPAKGCFGPGLDGITLVGQRGFPTQAQIPCTGVPEGDYTPSLLVLGQGYLFFSEFLPGQIHLYHNDRRLLWTAHTEPALPENAAEKRLYQAELRCGRPVRVKPGDAFRVVWTPTGGHVTIGPIRLHPGAPPAGGIRLDPPDWGKPADVWLCARWEEAPDGSETLPYTLHNPGTLPREVQVEVSARDYFQRPLLDRRETVRLAPGQKLAREIPRPASREWTRVPVIATAPGAYPPVRLVRFFRDDRREGPRPNTCLNGEWEVCFLPGAEPGSAPPPDAKWEKTTVPSLHPIAKGHCAWYRKRFDAPAHLRGERVLLKCGMLLSEGWFTLNGQPVGHERHGSHPFEVDLTPAFKPGQSNELLVAVRDWLAYSPRNRERVAAGEEPLFKENMVDVAGYPGAASLGIGGSVWLEGRPAVSVDDVFVVTSVREKKLRLRYRVANTTASEQRATLLPRVLDAGEVVKSLPETPVVVPAGGKVTADVEVAWLDARLWWPEDPHLYVLQTDVRPATGAADRHVERFGFREIRIDGIHFVLNGTRVKIRSAWAGGAHGVYQGAQQWQPEKCLEAIWSWQMHSIHEREVQLSRTHNLVGVKDACDVADETGLMIKIEESDVAQIKFTFDQAYWNAAVAHEVRVADTYKNHASVVMWSAGNENMWGWIYQGEAAKVLGNRWQVKIAQAIRDFDLMRRPVEWEADGDLMGKWEHHALHYPRELSARPDLPVGAWWGPLDGKTVVPYSMGPVTLGEKPLTVGEAFWPANLSHPYGQTILLGDEAYLGGHAWRRGWMESSQYFINGFRDAEFALIDIYNPLWMVKPQTIVLKEETRSFIGGQSLRRQVNVHNDIRRPAALTLRWSLTANAADARAAIALPAAKAKAAQGKPAADPGLLARGEMPLRLGPAELKRASLQVSLPAVKRPLKALLRVVLAEGGRVVASESREWQIHPPVSISLPKGLRLSVYDPAGQTTAMLRRLKVPFVPVKSMGVWAYGGVGVGSPSAGATTTTPQPNNPTTPTPTLPHSHTPTLLIGRDALKQPPEGPWREALGAFVRDGGKVLILEQSEAPGFLPVPLTLVAKRQTTMAFARAADHPALAGLSDADLRWWAGDHFVSAGNYRKPLRGNVLPLVDAGTMDGIVEAPLLEEYEGKGSYLLCQLLLSEKAATVPAAARMLQNILDYLAQPASYRTPGATALLARPESPLRKALDDSRLVYEDLTGKPDQLDAGRFQVTIAEASLVGDAPTAAALRAFAAAGGRVMLHRAGPEQQAALEGILGIRLRFLPLAEQPNDITYHVFRRENTGLMAGISNHELFWASNRLMKDLRHEGGWWSGYANPPEEWIADHYCLPAEDSRERARVLTRPGALVEVPVGKGSVILNQIRFEQPLPEIEVTATRLRSLLLTNLGCSLRGEGGAEQARRRRLQQYEFFPVDLAPYANRGLVDNKAAGIVGWTNQGENDMRALPTGRQVFAGIPFTIASPKGAIVLHSAMADNTGLPKEVKGIRVGRRADVLFFLHTVAWNAEKPFRYRVNYEDGTGVEITITNGQQVIDWWADPSRYAEAMARHGLFVAWQGDNPMRKGVILPGYEWANPHPEKAIRDIDFLTVPESNYTPVPVLAAITGAVSRPSEGVVTDVIGIHGAKVRLGTQEQEVYYIGVAPLPATHPFYAKAVAAHRALVVGEKVTVQRDVVTRDAEGREIAYLYLGRDTSVVRNLVNAKIIGDGLGKLGEFSGNNRHRMYLENLGFIAGQRKAGLWASEK